MIWRDPEYKLEIESVELRDEKEDDDEDDGHHRSKLERGFQ